MARRSAEHVVRATRHSPELRFRVDLHGVSLFGPGDERTLIRWEWVQSIVADEGVEVSSARAGVHFPAGTFGLPPDQLCALLQEGRGIERRSDVIATLGSRCS
jgi:hypothetical protein